MKRDIKINEFFTLKEFVGEGDIKEVLSKQKDINLIKGINFNLNYYLRNKEIVI